MSKRLILLLVLCVHLTTSAAILAKRKTAEQKEEAVKEYNEMRVSEAKIKEIGNMHELKYDYELEKVANSMTGNCEFKNGDYVLVPAVKLRQFLEQTKARVITVDRDVARVLYHPLQTKVACVELAAPCPARYVDEEGFCLFGPRDEALRSDTKKGPLGSHCDHGLADNGLCKAALKSATTRLNSLIFTVFAVVVMIFFKK
ncbi:hypothetical protein CAEBREN_15410 [Caenorhabditis brenneri]|uniref:Uncharacterized protein n=1 Tax=Caenorhabditis brenneri TaxID=135651 RepID=G0N2H6_CAEBE|nr:hypothetical protein CAEBREN_15410 [Caenorhabditis brenneri]